ncbi:MAG TPA: ABC transporter permease [Candidatus Dormibacteraeota bacterium]|nr:ABC transporter permease [Candidatus Dormibacteraeota bacterium]
MSVAPLPRTGNTDNFWRVFFIGGLISYRALFYWITPWQYIPTMLAAPLFQILFFVYLGRATGVGSTTFFVVGNSIQICSMSGIYGMTMALANERQFQTLSPILATPANRIALFLGRGLPVLASGLQTTAFGFLVSALILNFRPAPSALPMLALTVLITTASCTGFGMALGSIGLRARDIWLTANIAYFAMLLLCGVEVPLRQLPGALQVVAHLLPLTHGIAAGRLLATGHDLGAAWPLIWEELVVGAAWATIAFLLFAYFERQGRRTGSFDRL